MEQPVIIGSKREPLFPLSQAISLPFLIVCSTVCLLTGLLGTLVIPNYLVKPLHQAQLLGKAKGCPQMLDPHLRLFPVPYNSAINAVKPFTMSGLGDIIGLSR